MPRDELLDLVHATAQPAVTAHAVPRALLRDSAADLEEIEAAAAAPPLVVMGIVAILIATFLAIVFGTA